MQPAFASAFREDPLPALKALELPILIASGGKDKQVGRPDFDQLSATARNPRTIWIEPMNHVLVDVGNDADNMNAYSQPDRPLNADLTEGIVSFIAAIKH